MKRIYPVFLMLLLLCFNARAQTVIIGSGATSGTSSNGATGDCGPMYKSSGTSSFIYSSHHYLYTQAELAAAGLNPGSVITNLAWHKDNNAASNSNFLFQIWMKNSNLTAVQTPPQTLATLTTGSTQVYNSASTSLPATIGYIDFTLASSFTYTGGALEITVNYNHSSGSSPWTTAGISWKRDAISNRTISYCGSSASTTLSNARTVRPQLRITFLACTAPSNVNVSGITANSATVGWTGVSGSQGYEYVLTQSATPPTGAGTTHAGTTLNLASLTQNTDYWIHVRNKCSGTSFSGWVTVPFTTLTSCFPTTAVTVSNLTASTGTLFWTPVTGSAGYEYKIDQVAAAPTSGWTATIQNTIPFTGLTGGNTYYAHVRNLCTGGAKSSWEDISFTMPVCDAPANLILSNITDSTAHALWSMLPGANAYDYAVNFDKAPPTSNIQTTSSIAANIGGLQPNSKYYFHLRAKCFNGIDSSDWKLDSFITKMACYAPAINVNLVGTDNPYVYWDPVPTAIAYEYRVTNSTSAPAFGNELYITNVNINLEKDGKDYFVHVRAKCNSLFTFSPWSVAPLRTNTTGVAIVNNEVMDVYPNPAKEKLNFRNVPQGASYQLTDMTGRVLQTGIVESPILDIMHLTPGMYLLKVQWSGVDNNFKFMKQD